MVVSEAEPWMSDEDIGSGARWNDEVATALEETDFGIICLTEANLERSWMIFEAGALAKRLDVARVVPLCIDLPPSDVTGPLAAFQGRRLNEVDLKRLVHDLNATSEKPRAKDQVETIFGAMWPTLEADIARNGKQPGSSVVAASFDAEPQRTAQDMLAELVDRVRRLERDGSTPAARSDETLATVRVLLEKGHLYPEYHDELYHLLRDRLLRGI
jgi:TIR domain